MPSLGMSQQQVQRCQQSLEVEFLCLFCGQRIEDDESRRPRVVQLKMLEDGTDPYGHCLICGSEFPFHDSNKWRRMVRDYVRGLRQWGKEKKREARKLEKDRNWPEGTVSLVGRYWEGFCPTCQSEMRANFEDLYECPECRLQIWLSPRPVVMPLKGLKQWKIRDKNYIRAYSELPDYYGERISLDQRV